MLEDKHKEHYSVDHSEWLEVFVRELTTVLMFALWGSSLTPCCLQPAFKSSAINLQYQLMFKNVRQVKRRDVYIGFHVAGSMADTILI